MCSLEGMKTESRGFISGSIQPRTTMPTQSSETCTILWTDLLMCTFPIMLISVLGCFYLHMLKKTSDNSKAVKLSGRLEVWRRPVLVNDPLGIVSAVELMLDWATDDKSNIAGEITLLSGLALWATTFPRIRRKMFELFFYTHQLYVLFFVLYLLHFGVHIISLILPGIYLFVVDRYLRFLQSRRNVRLVSARLLPSETVELNFSKCPGFSYAPMSNVFINVPSISSLQWHPFTVSSNSNLEPETLSVIIKKEGK